MRERLKELVALALRNIREAQRYGVEPIEAERRVDDAEENLMELQAARVAEEN